MLIFIISLKKKLIQILCLMCEALFSLTYLIIFKRSCFIFSNCRINYDLVICKDATFIMLTMLFGTLKFIFNSCVYILAKPNSNILC